MFVYLCMLMKLSDKETIFFKVQKHNTMNTQTRNTTTSADKIKATLLFLVGLFFFFFILFLNFYVV